MSDPDPVTIGRALVALADSDEYGERDAFEATIAEARAAFTDISTAAQFLADGGEARLRRAVGAATRTDHPCHHDGHALLRDLSRLRASLTDDSTGPRAGDHFHSGRTTVFSGGGESADR